LFLDQPSSLFVKHGDSVIYQPGRRENCSLPLFARRQARCRIDRRYCGTNYLLWLQIYFYIVCLGALTNQRGMKPLKTNRLNLPETSPSANSLSPLLLVSRNFRQDWRLDRFLFLFLFRLIHRLTGRIHQPSGDKDDQIAFDVLIDIRSKQTTERAPLKFRL
jgi:hypothetical protein